MQLQIMWNLRFKTGKQWYYHAHQVCRFEKLTKTRKDTFYHLNMSADNVNVFIRTYSNPVQVNVYFQRFYEVFRYNNKRTLSWNRLISQKGINVKYYIDRINLPLNNFSKNHFYLIKNKTKQKIIITGSH